MQTTRGIQGRGQVADTGTRADVSWPEPSPLELWWEQVMYPDGAATTPSQA